MPAIRIQLPGVDGPSTISLTGERITIGRSPANTIQIVDRTLSARHAELVREGDHFRLRDLGSTNGTFVNEESVTDFHLRENCRIAFGTLEGEFVAEAGAENDPALITLPSRAEVNSMRTENAELRARLTALEEELATLRKASAPQGDEPTAIVPQAEYDKLLSERTAGKELQHKLEEELVQLRLDLAVLRKDRDNLQVALGSQPPPPIAAEPPAPAYPAARTTSPGTEAPGAPELTPSSPDVRTETAPPEMAAPAAPVPMPAEPNSDAAPSLALKPFVAATKVAAHAAPAPVPPSKPSVPQAAPAGLAPFQKVTSPAAAPRVAGAQPAAAPAARPPISPGLKPRVVATPKPASRPATSGDTQKLSD
jgi:pSer/pThr/pTyr-binding forkhead associated (FHA) protein